jgi:hypothetical protein
MSMRFVTRTAAALTASLCLAGAAKANVVDFSDVIFTPDPIGGLIGAIPTANGFDEQGLHFYTGEGFFIPAGLPEDPADPPVFPTAYSSTFWETYGEDVVITRTGGGLFDFTSLKLGLGIGLDGEPSTDIIHMSWIKGGACVVACAGGEDLNLGLGFSTYGFPGLTGLSSITFGPTSVVRYIAFDDINVVAPRGGGPVPEPDAWALMILGFGATGALIRRGRRKAALAA